MSRSSEVVEVDCGLDVLAGDSGEGVRVDQVVGAAAREARADSPGRELSTVIVCASLMTVLPVNEIRLVHYEDLDIVPATSGCRERAGD